MVYGYEEELVVKSYTDASSQTNRNYFRSKSRFVFCLNGGTVTWKSSKQEIVAESTTKDEYIVASRRAKEVVWIRKFITKLGIVLNIVDLIALYCDNNGANTQAKELRFHQRSKYILRRFHPIQKIIDE